jgi:hypothetical protein
VTFRVALETGCHRVQKEVVVISIITVVHAGCCPPHRDETGGNGLSHCHGPIFKRFSVISLPV